MNLEQYQRFAIVIGCILIIHFACNFIEKPAFHPDSTIPVSSEAAQSLVDSLGAALLHAQETGKLSLVVTEAQLTSFIEIEMKSQSGQFIENMQIYLRDGQVQIFGTVTQNGINAPLQLSINIYADQNGNLTSEIVSARLGPFPVPDGMLDMISSELEQALSNQVGIMAGDFYIDTIDISDGSLQINGHSR